MAGGGGPGAAAPRGAPGGGASGAEPRKLPRDFGTGEHAAGGEAATLAAPAARGYPVGVTPSASLYLIHLASTLAMTGVIWLVQLVQYPLFARVGADAFPRYHAGHGGRITWLVGPLMVAELATAAILAADPPAGVRPTEAALGLGAAVALWVCTGLVQVPLHGRLAVGFDAATHRALVRSNWVRTALWSFRSALVLGWVARLLPRSSGAG